MEKLRKYRLSKKYNSKLRRDWILEKWGKHKAEISMSDMAEIFGVDLSYIYRTIKKDYENRNNNKKT